jgi:hypothetical protein
MYYSHALKLITVKGDKLESVVYFRKNKFFLESAVASVSVNIFSFLKFCFQGDIQNLCSAFAVCGTIRNRILTQKTAPQKSYEVSDDPG